ncbi:tape measure domain-containing protein [Comamonas sp. BIGb0124]|uniref:tape measure protein n=1 Tax=Comamonas sp. BIGb0124 TaxID=2485130 RepID=UPI000F49AD11|nr:tape measure protein [Comamonas sp. BIGb0124]ROR21716.1 tape measure domain-containing protein [Comamonas sp. BIGb0124]
MAEKVGEIYYDVTLETQDLINKNREVNRELEKTKGNLDGLDTQLKQTAAAAKALFAGLGVLAIIDKADEWGQYASRIRMATKSTEEYNQVQDRMAQSANETYRSINETRESFIQMSPILREMGLTLSQSIDAIDTFSGLLVVNAASTDKARGAQDALSKSMQKGKVDADAWLSIYSTMDSVVDVIADSSGLTAEAIRKMGAEGKLSVEMLVKSLVDGNKAVMARVREMPTTFRDALQNVSNGFSEYIGRSNEAHGITQTLVSGIGLLGRNFNILADSGVAAAAAGLLAYGTRAAWTATQTIKLTQEAAKAEAATAQGAARAAESAKVIAAADLQRANAAASRADAQAKLDLKSQQSNLASLRIAQQQLAGERALEEQRLAAQINDVGRQKTATRMAEIRLAEVAVAKQVEAAEKSLGATTAATTKQIEAAYAERAVAAKAYGAATLAATQTAAAAEKAAAATSMVTRAGAALLAALGGPMGIAVTVGLSAAAWLAYRSASDEAKQSMLDMQQPVDSLAAKFKEMTKDQQTAALINATEGAKTAAEEANDAYEKLRTSVTQALFSNSSDAQGVQRVMAFKKALDDARQSGGSLSEVIERFAKQVGIPPEKIATWAKLTGAVSTADGTAKKATQVIEMLNLMFQGTDLAAAAAAAGITLFNKAAGGVSDAAAKQIATMARDIALFGKEASKLAAVDYELSLGDAGAFAGATKEQIDGMRALAKYRDDQENRRPKSGGSTKSDSASYLAGLEAAVADEWRKIEITEAEALRNAAVRHKDGADTAAEYERAKTLIRRRSANDREAVAVKEMALEERNIRALADQKIDSTRSQEQQISLIREEEVRSAQAAYLQGLLTFQEMEAAKTRALRDEEERRAQLNRDRQGTVVDTLQMRVESTGNPDDQKALAVAQAQAQMDAVTEMQERDLEQTQIYADQKAAIMQRLNTQLLDIQVASDTAQFAMMQSSAGQLYDLMKQAGKERTALGKAAFLAEKALSIASIIMNTEAAAAKAQAQLGVYGLPMAALIRTTGYASAAMVGGMAVAEVAGGRQYGGPTEAGKMYRVNETGQPEMYTASNGNQYMLPTKAGSVTPANELGGGIGKLTVIIENNGAPLKVTDQSFDRDQKILRLAVAEVGRQLAQNEGPVWTGAKAGTNIASRF